MLSRFSDLQKSVISYWRWVANKDIRGLLHNILPEEEKNNL